VIRVTVELLPGGDERRPQKIGEMKIWNQAATLPAASRYGFRYNSNGETVTGDDVAHRRSLNVFRLIQSVLNHSEPHPGYCHACHRENPEVPPDRVHPAVPSQP